MFLRVKEISGRRYVYLVEGKRSVGKVRQKTLSYLGPLSVLAFGVPEAVRKMVESKIQRKLDWNKFLESMKTFPLNLDELSELKQKEYALALRARTSKVRFERSASANVQTVFAQRNEGELEALARLAALGFEKKFEKLDGQKYRMRFSSR